jgi:biopolymer transport protein ExbD
LVSIQEEKAAVLMTPLIDCVFILLVFFLVTSMLSKPHDELSLDVPHSGVGKKQTEPEEPLVIVVTAREPELIPPELEDLPQWEPFVLIDGNVMTEEMLVRYLQQVAGENPNRRIRIDTDGHLKWRYVVDLIDTCRLYGLHRIEPRTH